jgi:hypothetical protein
MSFTPNALRLTDHPKILERAIADFRQVVMAEAVSMARYDDDITVYRWRSRAQALAATVEWTTEDGRKAFADRLAGIVQEAQVLREEAIATMSAACREATPASVPWRDSEVTL